ncbi:MAG: hypothetical protein ACHREM_27765, partial [Polyangiales bacterium]
MRSRVSSSLFLLVTVGAASALNACANGAGSNIVIHKDTGVGAVDTGNNAPDTSNTPPDDTGSPLLDTGTTPFDAGGDVAITPDFGLDTSLDDTSLDDTSIADTGTVED